MASSAFYDFRRCKVGTLVMRSPHYLQEHGLPAHTVQLGIVTDLTFMNDEGRVICYPRIHWEGEVTDHAVHPRNAQPWDRKLSRLRRRRKAPASSASRASRSALARSR